jgi:putative ABC transport system permease protein
MKQILFYIKEAFGDLLKNKGRTFLTSLGIIIGVYSVILLLALGEGLKSYIGNQFESLGTNMVYILPGKITSSGGGASLLGGKTYTYSDFKRLQSSIPEGVVVPLVTKNITAKTKLDSKNISLVGSTRDIFFVRNLTLSRGRYFSNNELTGGRKVVVIGSQIAEDLFEESNPVNNYLEIQSLRFKIVGVLDAKGGGGFGGPDFDSFVYSPYKAAWTFTSEKSFVSFYIKAATKEDIPVIVKKAERTMLKKFESDDFSIATQDELISTISGIFTVLNTVLVGIAAISLLVGGIGITNIMYVTVSERTREIGIRRALGAKEEDILLQFVSTSILLTGLGGGIGILLAYITAAIISTVFPVSVTLGAVALAFFVSFSIGVIFGVFPARKAAKLLPVEAIRYE